MSGNDPPAFSQRNPGLGLTINLQKRIDCHSGMNLRATRIEAAHLYDIVRGDLHAWRQMAIPSRVSWFRRK